MTRFASSSTGRSCIVGSLVLLGMLRAARGLGMASGVDAAPDLTRHGFELFSVINSPILCASVFLPVMCVLLVQPITWLSSPYVLVRLKSRRAVVCRVVLSCCTRSLLWSAVIIATSVPLMLRGGDRLMQDAALLAGEWVSFSALLCSLSLVWCGIAFSAGGKALASACVIAFGLVDVLASFIPGVTLPGTGWSLAILGPLSPERFLSALCVFGSYAAWGIVLLTQTVTRRAFC